MLIAQGGTLINSELAFFLNSRKFRLLREFLRSLSLDKTVFLFFFFFFERKSGWGNMERRDKENEMEKRAVRTTSSVSGPNENENVREPRHAKTTCLMVSLVRKKGKHGRTESGALSDRIFPSSTALSEFSFTVPLKLSVYPFLSRNRQLFYHSSHCAKSDFFQWVARFIVSSPGFKRFLLKLQVY